MESGKMFKDYITRLVEIEEEEEKYKNIMTEFKNEKDSLNNKIIEYMEKNNITNKDIIFGNRKIKYTKSKISENITKKLIEERLKIFFKNENQAADAVNFIYKNRNMNEKVCLKISLLNSKDEKST